MQRFGDASPIRRLDRVEGQILMTLLGKELQLDGIQPRRGLSEAHQAVCVQARSLGLRTGIEVAEGATTQKASDVLARQGADHLEQTSVSWPERQLQIAPLGASAGVVGEVDGFEILHHIAY